MTLHGAMVKVCPTDVWTHRSLFNNLLKGYNGNTDSLTRTRMLLLLILLIQLLLSCHSAQGDGDQLRGLLLLRPPERVLTPIPLLVSGHICGQDHTLGLSTQKPLSEQNGFPQYPTVEHLNRGKTNCSATDQLLTTLSAGVCWSLNVKWPLGSCVWTFGPWLLGLFWKVIGSSGSRDLLEKVVLWAPALRL